MGPLLVGVRHHSPACARVVRAAIRAVKPAYVLIEGPVDMNGRMKELLLRGHRPPLAIFSYATSPEGHSASWTPFCGYSPEWVAIQEGFSVGADVRFMDLPAWAKSFSGRRNRYADRGDRYGAVMSRLCEKLGVDGSDALWDQLFEQPEPIEHIAERLGTYFEALRRDPVAQEDEDGAYVWSDPGHDDAREEHMAQCIAWAVAQDAGPVLVVCGGWHAPALARQWRQVPAEWPELPTIEGGRTGSFLVPYTFKRLDSFDGYESGMPSPAWYQALWEHGPEQTPSLMLERAVHRLREKKQVVSSADLVAVSTLAQGLMRLRGHKALARVDLLDAMAGALVKDAQETPLPWAGRGTLRRGTDALVVELVDVFSGSDVGVLDPETPRPPLVIEVQTELKALDLEATRQGRRISLDLSLEVDRRRSRCLHRLAVLSVPGYKRNQGATWAGEADLSETWTLKPVLETQAAIIEASAYGATLETAAAARLEEMVEGTTDLGELTRVLGLTLFVGVSSLTGRMLQRVGRAIDQERQPSALGTALRRLTGLWRHETFLVQARDQAIGQVLVLCWDRALWVFEGLLGSDQPADQGRIDCAVGLRDGLRYAGAALGLDSQVAWSVMARRSQDPEAPPDVCGAALGFLWATNGYADLAVAEDEAVRALARVPSSGDFLAGLFAVAREEVLHADALVAAIDSRLVALTHHEFLVMLPPMRLAFSYFPPRERAVLAQAIAGRHGKGMAEAARLVSRLKATPEELVEAGELEERITASLARWGLEAS